MPAASDSIVLRNLVIVNFFFVCAVFLCHAYVLPTNSSDKFPYSYHSNTDVVQTVLKNVDKSLRRDRINKLRHHHRKEPKPTPEKRPPTLSDAMVAPPSSFDVNLLNISLSPVTSFKSKSLVPKPSIISHAEAEIQYMRCRKWSKDMLKRVLGPAFNSRYMAIDPPPLLDVSLDPISGEPIKPRDQPLSMTGPKEPTFYAEAGYSQVKSGYIQFSEAAYTSTTRFKRDLEEKYFLDPIWTTSLLSGFGGPSLEISDDDDPPQRFPRKSAATSDSKRLNSTDFMDGMPWRCDYEIRWIDLGADTFPRYIRNAVCTTKDCWFSHMECKPRAFTVHVLRRWSEKCRVPSVYNITLPGEESPLELYGDLNTETITDVVDNIKVENPHYPDPKLPSELQEKWVWVEIGVPFCCECSAKSSNPFLLK